MKIIYIILLSLLISCASPSWYIIGYSQIYNEYTNNYNKDQLDSICIYENIPSDLSKWADIILKDHESGDIIHRYTYIYKDSLMFVLDTDSINYILNKRIILK